jgi:ubiquinone/menaquinone biosynthesis C-methylase UbiE
MDCVTLNLETIKPLNPATMANSVQQHYHQEHLYETIIAAFEKIGIPSGNITRQLLAPADEFHIRGREVTTELAEHSGLKEGMQLLDVGCGIGGPARFLAGEYNCHATGIDLTAEYIRTAILLSQLTKQEHQTTFITADALHMPFADQTFDMAWTQHVQMNIADKENLYKEIYRVVKPGGRFIYYDILSTKGETIHFPVPWAGNPSLSFLITKEELRSHLTSAGFEIVETTDQTKAGIEFLEKLKARIQEQGLPPISLKLVVEEAFEEKFRNLYINFKEGKLRLESGVCMKK